FEQGLRTLLRQDPDVIMIGEIRDQPTARIAVQAGLTGHLVISTLHCGRATGVFARLIQMGIEPYLVASSIRAALAQRLVRRLCPTCRAQRGEEAAAGSGNTAPRRWYEPVGCADCDGLGYHGRIGLFELIEMDEKLRHMILAQASETELQQYAAESGTRNLADDAADKVTAGWTSREEVMGAIE
ncbi:TPA: type II secretion system protein GspE, partial [Candidatus Sumerlaeota bacterium]|nr:type II secretion system protein GspE [Candidatus Sumerlaeota bacterium]